MSLYVANQCHVARRVMRMVVALQKAPRTVQQLSILYGVNERTIYRDLGLIKDAGIGLEKDRNSLAGTRYRVTGL